MAGSIVNQLRAANPIPGEAAGSLADALTNPFFQQQMRQNSIMGAVGNQPLPTGVEQVMPSGISGASLQDSFSLPAPTQVNVPRAQEPNSLAPLLATLGGLGLNVAGALSGRGALGQSVLGVAENMQRLGLQKQAREQDLLESEARRQHEFQEKSRIFQSVKKQGLATAKLAEGIEDPRAQALVKGLALSGQTDEANRLLLGLESAKQAEERKAASYSSAQDEVLQALQSGKLKSSMGLTEMRAFIASNPKLRRRVLPEEASSILQVLQDQKIIDSPGFLGVGGTKADPAALKQALQTGGQTKVINGVTYRKVPGGWQKVK